MIRSKTKHLPVALTIAGSDSGGGAGIQADLKTFASLGVHGTSAITCVTAQDPERVLGIQACRPQIVKQQLEAVFAAFQPGAVKTGMLYSAGIIRAVVGFLKQRGRVPLVVDPVMIASSGAPLLKASAVKLLENDLLPLATLATPNLHETEVLLGRPLKSVGDMRLAAKEIHRRFGCAALVKGGHLRGATVAADVLSDGRNEWLLTAPFVRRVRAHGTGCTYAAAIAAGLARGCPLPRAVAQAKEYVSQAIVQRRMAGNHVVLNSFWRA